MSAFGEAGMFGLVILMALIGMAAAIGIIWECVKDLRRR